MLVVVANNTYKFSLIFA